MLTSNFKCHSPFKDGTDFSGHNRLGKRHSKLTPAAFNGKILSHLDAGVER